MGFNMYLQSLIAKANKSSNKDEVKNIRNKLIKYGLVAGIGGFLGVFVCFVSFAVLGFSAVSNFNGGFSMSILIPFFLLIPCGVVGSLGLLTFKAGVAIVVVQKGTEFLDENKYCPECGDVVADDEQYCNKCGTPLLIEKICRECDTKNDLDSKFCKTCGSRL